MVEKDVSVGMVYQTTLSTKYRGGRGGITIGLNKQKRIISRLLPLRCY